MGCFLGCFGFSSKRKRRKPANGGLHRGQKLGSYEPLNSAYANLDKEEPVTSHSEHSKKPKETLNCKLRKKVSFNLNVQTYEPIPREESANHFWESDEEEKKEEKCSEETDKESRSYPSNYRYGNCIESYNEEDYMAYEESDLDDDGDNDDFDYDYDYDYNCDKDGDDLRISQEEYPEQFSPFPSSQNGDLTQLAEDHAKNLKPLDDSNEGALKSLGMNRNAGDRSQYALSLLNPIENLSQWKALKTKGLPPVKHQRKENVESNQQKQQNPLLNFSHSLPLIQEISVDASLSNWLGSNDSYQSKSASVTTKCSTIDVDVERTYSWRSREDMPILDFNNMEA